MKDSSVSTLPGLVFQRKRSRYPTRVAYMDMPSPSGHAVASFVRCGTSTRALQIYLQQTWPVFLRPVKIPYISRIPYFTGTVRYGDRSLRYGNSREDSTIYGYGKPRKIRDTGKNFYFLKMCLHTTMDWLMIQKNRICALSSLVAPTKSAQHIV